eukprot:SM000030S11366  [mRNA]  locus=s30:316179:318407:- [translate_table: standard]
MDHQAQQAAAQQAQSAPGQGMMMQGQSPYGSGMQQAPYAQQGAQAGQGVYPDGQVCGQPLAGSAADFKSQQLPLARIKKIMKSDEDVRMISAEAPVLFAKACEMFILELTLRSWIHTEENKRRTLQRNDIAAAITRTDIFDFLVDIVPRDDPKEEIVGPRPVPVGGANDVPYTPVYYLPQQPGAPTMQLGSQVMAGQPGMPMQMMYQPQYVQQWQQPLPQ